MAKKKPENYVDNEELLEAIKEYKKTCIKYPDTQVPNYIAECIYKISVGVGKRPNFINYPFKDDMIGEGVIDCLRAVKNFDPEKGSKPFAYFTQICWYAFLKIIGKEKKQKKIKYAMIENANGMGQYSDWLRKNKHLDDHSSVDDIARYHSLTDDDLKELDDIKNDDLPKRKSKKITHKKSLFETDGENDK